MLYLLTKMLTATLLAVSLNGCSPTWNLSFSLEDVEAREKIEELRLSNNDLESRISDLEDKDE